jgi:predicted ferric reductase
MINLKHILSESIKENAILDITNLNGSARTADGYDNCIIGDLILDSGETVLLYKKECHRISQYAVQAIHLVMTKTALNPVLLALGYSHRAGITPFEQYQIFIRNWHDVQGAFIGYLLFLMLIVLAIPLVRKRLVYEHWYFTHLLVYVAIFLSFGHQTKTATVSWGNPYYYWMVLNLGIGALYIFYRFLRPYMRFFKHQFYIDKVVQETPDVYSVYIKGKNIEQFTYEAGQFANYTFLQKGMYFTHPFSFSTAPNAEYIRISVRGVGDFTRRIPELRPGTKVVIDGPLGIFTERSSARDKYLFIAGGIGITPLRSLAEDLSKRGKDITLLYGNRTADNIPLKAELEAMPIKISHILSMIPAATHTFEQGYLDKEKILRLAPDFIEREIYVCGPPIMMDLVIPTLMQMGVPQKHIHFERFGY